MTVHDLIPKNARSFSVKNDMLYFDYHGMKLPVAYVTLDDYAYVFLDVKMMRQVAAVVQLCESKGYRFFMAYPDDADPAGVINWHDKIVKHYLTSHLNPVVRSAFAKIGFDLIRNLCEWVKVNGDITKVKEIYDGMNRSVEYHYYDYFSKKNLYTYPEEVRAEWPTIWREIQINTIL